jgi:Flp pilus assembly protein TadD
MKRALVGSLAAFLVALLTGVGSSSDRSTSEQAFVPLTFNKDIAPIIFESCSSCHRPGGGAPFDLLTYDDVRRRSRQITVVTESRYMPPWHPAQGRGEFAGKRALSKAAIEMIAQWHREGSKEGNAGDLPAVRTWPQGWALGPPDLVLEIPEAYELAADGPDVYRNFVLSVPLDNPVQVRALDFNPGNARVVHHAFVLLDPTDTSRRLAEETPGPGFGFVESMQLPNSVVGPGDGGFFIGWNPGRRVFRGYDDMSWPLDSTYDFVLQLHLQPSGKTERVRPSIALYFAEQPPTRFPLVIGSRSSFIDIPAGEDDYQFEIQYTLPVDIDVLAVSPHAHYIAKDMQGFAELPDGTKEWLLHIEDWDFNWQEDYRYEPPVFLPKGTRITQRFTFDNSSSNPRNPVSPPRRVVIGESSLDEMGELWFQVLPRRPEEREVLKEHWMGFLRSINTQAFEYELIANEQKRKAMKALLVMAKSSIHHDRVDEAIEHAAQASRKWPDEAEPYYALGRLLLERGRDDELRTACRRLARAIRIRPDFFEAHMAIGVAWQRRGDPDKAEQAFANAHELSPQDPSALFSLGVLAAEQGKMQTAVEMFEKTLSIDPAHKPASDALELIAAKSSGSPKK